MRRILAATLTRDLLFVLTDDGVNEARKVLQMPLADPTATPIELLLTNDSLFAIDVDHESRLWVAGGSGHVHTQAPVISSSPVSDALVVDYPDEPSGWSLAALPGAEEAGYEMGGQAIWVAAQDAVFFGTFSGQVHAYLGGTWKTLDVTAPDGIEVIAGTGPNDVWFGGGEDGLFHYDGSEVAKASLVEGEIQVSITGIAPTDSGMALVSTAQGHLLTVGRRGPPTAEFMPGLDWSMRGNVFSANTTHAWSGLKGLDGTTYLAGRDGAHAFLGDRFERRVAAPTPKKLHGNANGIVLVEKGRRTEGRVRVLRAGTSEWTMFRFPVGSEEDGEA